MIRAAPDPGAAWPLLLYAALVFFLAAVIVGLAHLLGQRHRERETGDPFESGVATTGPARFRFSVQFYLFAMFFVIFDIESAFLFAWAIAFRDLGWGGFAAVLVFALTFLLMIFYLALVGALDITRRPGGKTGRRGAASVKEEGL